MTRDAGARFALGAGMRINVSDLSRIGAAALACLAFAASTATAQGSLQSFTVKAGFTASTLAPAPSGTTSFAPGFVAGVAYTPSPNTFTWQLEGLVQQQGSGIGAADVHLLYLNVPFLLRMNFRQDRSTFFYAVAGGSAGFLLAGTLDQDGQTTDLAGLMNRTAVDAIVGVGCDIHRRYSIEVRWNEGLRKTAIVIDGVDTRNRSVSVTFGVRLRG